MNAYALCLFILQTAALGVQAQPNPAPPQPLAITHVTVIDATGGPSQLDMTVVTSGNRISDLGKTGRVAIPKDAVVVDGSGQFLIPGLWDMHCHLVGVESLGLFVANGVTGVREMGNYPQLVFSLREETAKGTRLGPRMVAAGKIVDGPKPVWPFSVAAGNETEGRAAVTSVKREGSDFVKVYSKLPREAYFAILDEAKKQGLAAAGHLPLAVSAAEASDAGQKCMEHLIGLLLACSTKEADLRKEAIEGVTKTEDVASRILGIRTQIQAADTYSEEKAAALFARFVKNGTWQCPTLTVLRSLAYLDDKDFTNDSRLKYVSPFVKSALLWKPNSQSQDLADRKRLFNRYLELVRAMHRAKVSFLAGTDTPNPYCFPGFSLSDELTLLVKAGLTPMEALQAATYNPAKYFGTLKDAGTVEKGKFADLVLLEADPLTDIRHTQKIAAVVLRGRLLPKETLQKTLADVEAGYKK
jgi:imidazolonepropionase-like amidohydrolase